MTNSNPGVSPAFGQAVLSNCEREQIHLPGSIQPHGALLVFDELHHEIVQASANAADFLGLAAPLVGKHISEVSGELPKQLERLNVDSTRELPLSFQCTTGSGQTVFDCLFHRNSDDMLIAEFLQRGERVEISGALQEAVHTISKTNTIEELCDQTAEIVYALTGYDRVMVYEFDPEGHGSVRAEKFEKDLEAYLGQRYPASDIPQIARKLYLQNRIRLLVDVEYTPVPVEPRLLPEDGRDIDMSMCFLRSTSPIHIQYLKNMGVAATLVISLVVGGELWGLIACHHYSRRIISNSLCAACELLAENIATRISAFEGNAQAHVNWSVRRFEAHMIEGVSRFGDWKEALFNGPEYLLRPVDADGAALFVDTEIFTAGVVPGTHTLREIRSWLMDQDKSSGLIATTSLSREDSRFEPIKEVASGLLAVPISNSSTEFLVWFRPEQLRTDIWGGNPEKAMEMGDDPEDLSPRRSFAKWYQQVDGTCVAWSLVEQNLANRMGQSVADLVLHFRSVRALIIEDQLNSVFRRVSESNLPVVISDASRKILLANEAFQSLLPPGHKHLSRLEDLPALFANPQDCRRRITELCDEQRAWRGEVVLAGGTGEPLSLSVRGDPVFVADHRTIGYVLVFNSLAEQKAVEVARQRFQQSIVSQNRILTDVTLSEDLDRRKMVSTIVGSAKLAALEITDGEDVHRISNMLDSVRASVSRSMELLEHLSSQDKNDRS